MADFQDDALVRAVRAGGSAAFKALYERYARALFGFLWRRTRDREVAEDLTQETFVRVWRHRDDLDPARSVRAYLFQIARRLAVDHLRRKAQLGVAAELDSEQPAAEVDPDAFAKRDRIRQALAALPQQQRAVFCLSRFDGLKYAEIAETLELSVKTVEVHMGRALKKLRDLLRDLAVLLWLPPFL